MKTKSRIVAVVLCIVFCVSFMTGCNMNPFGKSAESGKEKVKAKAGFGDVGNDPNNLLEGGTIAFDDENIYYKEYIDNDNGNQRDDFWFIMQVKRDNSGKKKFKCPLSVYPRYLNVYNGHLYYVADDSSSSDIDRVMKIELDTGKRSLLSRPTAPDDYGDVLKITNMLVTNGCLFYTCDYSSAGNHTIMIIAVNLTDGKESVIYNAGIDNTGYTAFRGLVNTCVPLTATSDHTLYAFIDSGDASWDVYSLNTDTLKDDSSTQIEKVAVTDCYIDTSTLIFYPEGIYYTEDPEMKNKSKLDANSYYKREFKGIDSRKMEWEQSSKPISTGEIWFRNKNLDNHTFSHPFMMGNYLVVYDIDETIDDKGTKIYAIPDMNFEKDYYKNVLTEKTSPAWAYVENCMGVNKECFYYLNPETRKVECLTEKDIKTVLK